MYYRYRVNKKNFKWLKFFVIAVILAGVFYLGTRYKQHIFFWKYSNSKLQAKVDDALAMSNLVQVRQALKDVGRIVNDYLKSDILDSDLLFLSGDICYNIANTYMPGTVSEMVISDAMSEISKNSRKYYIRSIRLIKQGRAQLDGDPLSDKYRVILAKALYLTGYCSKENLLQEVRKIKDIKHLPSVEDIRFCVVVMIENEQFDEGLALLKEAGDVENSAEGILFLASIEKLAKRYTNAIISYKKVLEKTDDNNVRNLVYYNLGRVYYHQSLFKEALKNFNLAAELNKDDTIINMWIGKCYYALGYKTSAIKIWKEILESSPGNQAVKKLLGIRH